MSELKPCPFCGSDANYRSGYDIHKVGCSNFKCFLRNLPVYPEQWNNRPNQWVSVEEIEEIKKQAVRDHIRGMYEDAQNAIDNCDNHQLMDALIHYHEHTGECAPPEPPKGE